MTGVLIQRGNLDTDRDAHSGRMVLIPRNTRREPCDSWDRLSDDLHTEGYQGLCSRQTPGDRRSNTGVFPVGFGGSVTLLNTLILDFWPPEQ